MIGRQLWLANSIYISYLVFETLPIHDSCAHSVYVPQISFYVQLQIQIVKKCTLYARATTSTI
jgi:hypothetical protein